MFNLQGSEIIVILLVALVVLGPEKLPDAVRRASRTYHELKKMGTGFQSELKAAIDEPMREMRETADLVRDAADPRKLSEPSSAAPADADPAPAADPGSVDETATDATTAGGGDPLPGDAEDVMGEMWEDDPALDPGSHTVGIPPGAHDDDPRDQPAQ